MKRITILVALIALVGLLPADAAGPQFEASGTITNPVTVELLPPPGDPVTLVLDDGAVDNNIGIGGTWEFLFVNRFTPAPSEFPFELTEVQAWFSGGTAGVAPGDGLILVAYENLAGNTDPGVGSNLLYQGPEFVQAVDAWSAFTLPAPVEFNGPGDAVIGFIALEIPGVSYFPAAIDTTASQGRSWAGWYLTSPPPNPPVLPPDDTWGLIDQFGFPGNWMVRGTGTVIPVELQTFTID